MQVDERPVVLVTGAAWRVGRVIARTLHAAGYDLVIHYRNSRAEAEQFAAELDHARARYPAAGGGAGAGRGAAQAGVARGAAATVASTDW